MFLYSRWSWKVVMWGAGLSLLWAADVTSAADNSGPEAPVKAQAGVGVLHGRVTIPPASNALPAVVYVVGFDEPAPPETPQIHQVSRLFEPAVLPITRGQRVQFENLDVIPHNVFSMSNAKTFDLGQGKKGQSGEVEFTEAGIVDVYCNIHPEMAATILILPNRRYAVTDDEGTYRIADIPPGDWTVFVWHRLAEPQKQGVSVRAGEVTEMNWELRLDKQIEPHLNKRGMPYRKPQAFDSDSENAPY